VDHYHKSFLYFHCDRVRHTQTESEEALGQGKKERLISCILFSFLSICIFLLKIRNKKKLEINVCVVSKWYRFLMGKSKWNLFTGEIGFSFRLIGLYSILGKWNRNVIYLGYKIGFQIGNL
jgi:nucleoside recognition membrane protein YjiH